MNEKNWQRNSRRNKVLWKSNQAVMEVLFSIWATLIMKCYTSQRPVLLDTKHTYSRQISWHFELDFFFFCINLNGCTTTVHVVLKLFKEILHPKWKLCHHLLQLNLFQPVCLSSLCRNTNDDNISVFWIPFTFIVHKFLHCAEEWKAF